MNQDQNQSITSATSALQLASKPAEAATATEFDHLSGLHSAIWQTTTTLPVQPSIQGETDGELFHL